MEPTEDCATMTLEFEREEDGRWVAAVVELPGVLAYGSTSYDACLAALALAHRTQLLAQLDAGYAALQKDPAGWAQEQAERDGWDVALPDGLEPDDA